MVVIPTLETERLVLRAHQESDFGAFAMFFADPISKFYGGPAEREDAWRKFAMYPGHWLLRGYGPWALELKSTGECIGQAGPWFPEGWAEPEITWALVPGHHGRGYASEAASASLRAAYELFGWTTAVSVISVDNGASIAVAERLGATFERDVAYRYGQARLYRHRGPSGLSSQAS